jgi:hypothetical protein
MEAGRLVFAVISLASGGLSLFQSKNARMQMTVRKKPPTTMAATVDFLCSVKRLGISLPRKIAVRWCAENREGHRVRRVA